MSTSQPIALRPSTQDYHMQDSQGSYSASPFNPASYTRQFIGSPISWRGGSYGMSGIASSWGQRFAVGSPTHRLLSTWEASKSPASIDAERDSILNALSVFDREGELCRNYNCCGIHLDDLHALLEHFEEVHIVVVDRDAPNSQAHIQVPFNPQVNDMTPQQQAQMRQRRQQQDQMFNQPRQPQASPSFDTDDMELELDLDPQPLPTGPPPSQAQSSSSPHSSPSSSGPSPPGTPISTPHSAYPSPHAFAPSHLSPYVSQPSSPLSGTAASTRQSSPTGTSTSNSNIRPNLNVNLTYHPRSHLSSPSILANPEDAFNTYARFSSDYSSGLPGAQYNGANVDEASALTWQQVQALQQVQQQQSQQQQDQQAQTQQQMNGCLPPALLFAPSASCTPAGTPGGSRVPSPTPQASSKTSSPTANATKGQVANGTTSPQRGAGAPPANANPQSAQNPTVPGAATPANAPVPANLLRPASSLLLSKPFRCPKPNCNKSYKQANGLKYHMTHGSCNFAPPKDLEHVKDLLERKRRERDAQVIANGGTPNRAAASSGVNGSAAAYNNPAHIGGLPTTLDTALLNSYYDLNLQSMNITETELREVEREAEKRLRPFACGVGDCQRRYKNMNGLRYHYQHSGEHGAVGLALLASGQHECLQNNHNGKRREQQQQSTAPTNTGYATTTFAMDEEREGRKRFGGSTAAFGTVKSSSTPVSRAGSTSRAGTPVPASANTSPRMMNSTTSSLSGALGHHHVVNGVGINTGLPPSPRADSASPQAATTATSPTTTVPSPTTTTTTQQQQQHLQQMAAAAYQQYAQQFQRQYQAAMQMHVQQQQQQQAAAGAASPTTTTYHHHHRQQQQQQPQQQQGDWASGMAMDMS